jgi:putative DNA methylase
MGRGRSYVTADSNHSKVAILLLPETAPDAEMDVNNPSLVSGRGYGLTEWQELFNPRQLTAMVTLSDLVKAVRTDILRDAKDAGLDGKAAEDYATTITTFLANAKEGRARQVDAATSWNDLRGLLVSTDPPYYDNRCCGDVDSYDA